MLQPVHYEVDGQRFTGFLADGSGAAPAPGVLVVHEGGGLTDHAKGVAERLAAEGYVTFAPDLFGMEQFELERAKGIVADLREHPDKLRRRMRAAYEVLSDTGKIADGLIAAIGYCFGGTAAIELGRSGMPLAAIVGFHAGLTTASADETRNIRCPLLLCLGAADPVVTEEMRRAFIMEADEAGIDWQLHLYGAVGHSFTNPEIDSWKIPGFAHDPVAERRSWAAMRHLFGEVFGR